MEIKYKEGTNILESFSISKVEFGTDSHDGKLGTFLEPDSNDNINYTLFGFDNKTYVIIIMDDGQIKFNLFTGIPTNYELLYDFVQYKRVNVENIFVFFSSLFYVILQGISFLKLQEFYFYGHDEELQHLYEKIATNKMLTKYLKRMGIEYVGKDDQDNLCFVVK